MKTRLDSQGSCENTYTHMRNFSLQLREVPSSRCTMLGQRLGRRYRGLCLSTKGCTFSGWPYTTQQACALVKDVLHNTCRHLAYLLRARGIASFGKASPNVLAGMPGGPWGSSRTLYCLLGEPGSAIFSVVQPISLHSAGLSHYSPSEAEFDSPQVMWYHISIAVLTSNVAAG